MSELSTMLEQFITKCASDENLRSKVIDIVSNSSKDEMPNKLMSLAEEVGVPFTTDEAMKLMEDPEVMSALGLSKDSGLGSIISMAENFLEKK